jgi:serine/threonine protein phosphatase PrpC
MKSPIYACRTHTGQQREHNEDAVAILPGIGAAILADGMGGHNAGEVASQIAVDLIATILQQTAGVPADARLETALQAAHAGIRDKASSSLRFQGMGTTAVVTFLEKNRLSYAHVGDSRLYRWRKGRLEQLTRDHSLQQEFIDKGYSPAEAAEKVGRNILTRALGLDGDLIVDVGSTETQDKDRYLLCSDGLYEMASDDEIATWLARGFDAETTCEALIDLANTHGGRDNISVTLIDIP